MVSFLVGIIITLVTFYIAFIYESASIGLLGFAEAVLIVLAFLLLLYMVKKFTATINIPVSVTDPGKKAAVYIKTEYAGKISCMKIRYQISEENVFLGTHKCRWRNGDIVYSGRHTYEHYFVPKYPGNYVHRLKKIRVYDPTGLFYLTKKVKEEAWLMVMPEVTDIPPLIRGNCALNISESDFYDDSRPGNGRGEMFGVREYRAGDRIQDIHWKLSARMDTLMIREDCRNLSCAVAVILDRRAKANRKETLHYLSVAAGVAYALTEASCPYYVAWYSSSAGDMERMRIENEESYYSFLNRYMTGRDQSVSIEPQELYRDKYGTSDLVYTIVIAKNLKIYLNGNEVIL